MHGILVKTDNHLTVLKNLLSPLRHEYLNIISYTPSSILLMKAVRLSNTANEFLYFDEIDFNLLIPLDSKFVSLKTYESQFFWIRIYNAQYINQNIYSMIQVYEQSGSNWYQMFLIYDTENDLSILTQPCQQSNIHKHLIQHRINGKFQLIYIN